MAELAAAGMEGGSPSLIWERWTLPMYYAQHRYWSDHPRLDQIAAAYFKLPQRKTPPPSADGTPAKSTIDWSLLDADAPWPGAPTRVQQIVPIDQMLAGLG